MKKQGQRIAVIGCGPVGLMAIHYATMMRPSQLIAIDTVEERVDMAKKLGATHGVVSTDARAEVKDITNNDGVDAVIDCAGVAPTIQTAFDIVAPDSHISILGIPNKPIQFDVAASLMKTQTIWTGLGEVSYAKTVMKNIADGLLKPDMAFNH